MNAATITAAAARFDAAQEAYDQNTERYNRAHRDGDTRGMADAMNRAHDLCDAKGNAQADLIRAQRAAKAAASMWA